jgi:hypothetical protein
VWGKGGLTPGGGGGGGLSEGLKGDDALERSHLDDPRSQGEKIER